MFLIDTNVVSELRKAGRAHAGVKVFFETAREAAHPIYLSVITVGELRRGVELIRYRGDLSQAQLLDTWLQSVMTDYQANILPFGPEAAQVWGRLRVPHPHHEIDKQIAATALVYGLTVVTRNSADFAACGVPLLNPFLDA